MGYIDIEDALQQLLNAAAFNACARPLPASFSTPHVCVGLLNAADANRAQGLYNVAFDCRASDYAGAVALQNSVADWARGLEGQDIGGKPCHQIDSILVQRAQPDSANEGVILGTVSVGFRVRIAD